MNKRVVVTGLGLVTPLGVGRHQFARGLFDGRSGLGEMTRFDSTPYGIRCAGEVHGFEARQFISARNWRRMDRLSTYAVASAVMALEDAGLGIDDRNSRRIGVVLGTAFGSTEVATQFGGAIFQEGPRFANPILVPNTVMNAPAGHTAIEIGARGINTTLNHRETSAENAIAYASSQIALGRVDVVLAGGAEIISEFMVAVLSRFKALSGLRGGEEAAKPFDRFRNGPIVSEGAGVLCLESLPHAMDRNAEPYCEIAGFGMSAAPSPANAWPEDPSGPILAIHRALAHAELKPEQIDHVSACANGGPELDILEARALTQVFGQSHCQPWISSVKGALGESYSAGGIRAATMALGLKSQIVTPHLGTTEPIMPLRLAGNQARPAKLNHGLLNTISSGGTFCALILKHCKDDPS